MDYLRRRLGVYVCYGIPKGFLVGYNIEPTYGVN
jgi:hypothetical protein